ncbi:ultraviolet-B receptor UVR8-like isoform X1 [Olea europaea var. sylvestris]|uniref:ultraviolet-B receptor UVR8-like isoform X1 n=1 Tax=Olea europaea var. sylvestris TaxID=158386 RepID=UPI000C1D79A5|nr:ultraviolet-B receptor UVR8-like isoform X1 [Olea europaea var. sylvestris]
MTVRFLTRKYRPGPGILWGLVTRLTRRWMTSTNKTTVMSFGDGSHGALGLPMSQTGPGFDAYEPTPVSGLPPYVSTISAGHYHSLAVTSEGHVWAWGRNYEAQLGRGSLSPRETWNEPQKVQGLSQVKVRAAFASGVISAAIGDDGSLWVWGKSKRGQLGLGKDITEAVLPSRVEALTEEDIIKVSLGWGHALALTKDGKLFGWGYYADGRLGKIGEFFETSPLDSVASKVESSGENSGSMTEAAEGLIFEAIEKEKNMPIAWEPTSIKELGDVKFVDMACGLDHSLVLDSDGTLLSGGSNAYGQLGRVNQDLGLLPVDMSFIPVNIASGLGHSLAICNDTSSDSVDGLRVVTWGWNQSYQLGRKGPQSVPLVVEGLSGETPVSLSGGRVHSLAVTAKNEIWTWGCGRNGRLGLGSSADEVEPMLVECLEGSQVLQAVAGFDHNLVLIAE